MSSNRTDQQQHLVNDRQLTGDKQDGQANNNEDDFQSNYHHQVVVMGASSNGGGRLSSGSGGGGSGSGSGSGESAFSSASDDGEDSSTSSHLDGESASAEDDHHSSGRSSQAHESTGDLTSDAKQLNTTCNLIPETEQAQALVERVRLKFLESLKAKEEQDYEACDLIELRRPLPRPEQQEQSQAFRFISRFLNFNSLLDLSAQNDDVNVKHSIDKEIHEACEKLKDFLLFRRHFQVPRTEPDHFFKELFLLNGIFPFGVDKQQLPVLYLRARVHRRWSHKLDESFRRYVAWQVDLITKSHSGCPVGKTVGRQANEKDGSFGICFDCLNVSYSCVDMDFLRFLVKVLVNYYPTYCRYSLCVDLPWLFRSVWKLVRSWLPEEAQNTVQLITSKQLTDYIHEDQIPNSIRINEMTASEKPPSGRHRLPENWESFRTIDDMAEELNLSSNEIKQFKNHIGKVVKEYEQLGAI